MLGANCSQIVVGSRSNDNYNKMGVSLASPLYSLIPKSSHDIRIIIPHPSSPNLLHERKTKCSFVQEFLERGPEFEALSYAWGKAGTEREIFVDGLVVAVRENLWDALFHLREGRDWCLRIDCLCIDQTNIAERKHQV